MRFTVRALLGVVTTTTLLGGLVAVAMGRETQPVPTRQLGPGSAWFASRSTGAAVLIDGTTGRRIKRVAGVAEAGSAVAVEQYEASALIVNQSDGSVRRLDGATWTPGARQEVGGANDERLRVLTGGGAVWAIAQDATQVKQLDPRRLDVIGAPETLPATISGAAVGRDGSLWVTSETGEVRSYRDGALVAQSALDGMNRPALVMAGDVPVAVDTAAGTARRLDPDGAAEESLCLDVPAGSRPLVGGATSSKPWLLAVVPRAGTLIVSDTRQHDCRPFRLGPVGSEDRYGEPVERDGRVYVPDRQTGEVVVVNPDATHLPADNKVETRLDLRVPDGVAVRLLSRDRRIWWENPEGDEVGVITEDLKVITGTKGDDPGLTPDDDGDRSLGDPNGRSRNDGKGKGGGGTDSKDPAGKSGTGATPDKPTPDKPTPDKPTPDKPASGPTPPKPASAPTTAPPPPPNGTALPPPPDGSDPLSTPTPQAALTPPDSPPAPLPNGPTTIQVTENPKPGGSSPSTGTTTTTRAGSTTRPTSSTTTTTSTTVPTTTTTTRPTLQAAMVVDSPAGDPTIDDVVVLRDVTPGDDGHVTAWSAAGGNPGNSTERTLRVRFSEARPHTVTLTVTGSDGRPGTPQTRTINVLPRNASSINPGQTSPAGPGTYPFGGNIGVSFAYTVGPPQGGRIEVRAMSGNAPTPGASPQVLDRGQGGGTGSASITVADTGAPVRIDGIAIQLYLAGTNTLLTEARVPVSYVFVGPIQGPEDCLPYNPATVATSVPEGSAATLVTAESTGSVFSGTMTLGSFRPGDAPRAVAVARASSAVCIISPDRYPDGSITIFTAAGEPQQMTYFKGGPPPAIGGEVCNGYDPVALRVEARGANFVLVGGGIPETAAGDNATDAQKALSVARRANQVCTVPQFTDMPVAVSMGAMEYFR